MIAKARALSPGEIAENMHVTILSDVEVEEKQGGADIVYLESPHQRRSAYTGVPLCVLAVDLPFVLVQVVGTPNKISLDTRLYHLMEMKPEFAQAFARNEQIPASEFHQLLQAHNHNAAVVNGAMTQIAELRRKVDVSAAPAEKTPPAKARSNLAFCVVCAVAAVAGFVAAYCALS